MLAETAFRVPAPPQRRSMAAAMQDLRQRAVVLRGTRHEAPARALSAGGRRPIAKRIDRTLARVDEGLRRRRHQGHPGSREGAGQVCRGRLDAFAVPGPVPALVAPQAATPVDAGAAAAVPCDPASRPEEIGAQNRNPVVTRVRPPPRAGSAVCRPPPEAGSRSTRGAAMRIPAATGGSATTPPAGRSVRSVPSAKRRSTASTRPMARRRASPTKAPGPPSLQTARDCT